MRLRKGNAGIMLSVVLVTFFLKPSPTGFGGKTSVILPYDEVRASRDVKGETLESQTGLFLHTMDQELLNSSPVEMLLEDLGANHFDDPSGELVRPFGVTTAGGCATDIRKAGKSTPNTDTATVTNMVIAADAVADVVGCVVDTDTPR